MGVKISVILFLLIASKSQENKTCGNLFALLSEACCLFSTKVYSKLLEVKDPLQFQKYFLK